MDTLVIVEFGPAKSQKKGVIVAVDSADTTSMSGSDLISRMVRTTTKTRILTVLSSNSDSEAQPDVSAVPVTVKTNPQMVSFSTLPVDAGALYSSLDRYPYGCTEQTVSRAMPLLYAEQLVGLATEAGETPEPSDDGARTRVQEAINTLLNRQSADGAFGLWRESDRYATP